jgi:hypothetical protein
VSGSLHLALRASAALGVALLPGCGSSPPAAHLDATITTADVKGTWPLAGAPVEVNCGDGKTTIFLEAGGRAYPVNNAAEARPEAYTGQLAVNADAAPLYKADPRLVKYGNLHYPTDSVLSVAIERCRRAGLTTLG